MEKTLYQKMIQEIDKSEMVSFDVFDTLLVRPFAAPTDVFKYIEHIYQKSGFAAKRIEAERLARKKKGNIEVTLEDIYTELKEYAECSELEMNCEEQFLQANQAIKDLFDYAVSSGKKTIIVSDMYLPSSFIDRVLKKNGYCGYDRIFVSSEFGKTKHDGSLFDVVLWDYNISAMKVLHVGDNITSDYEQPRSRGIRAIHIQRSLDMYLQHRHFRRQDCRSVQGSALTKVCADRFQKGYDNYWHKFGFEFAGPLCWAFSKWIWDEIHEDKRSDRRATLFVARDGYLLKKICEKIAERIGEQNERMHYVFAPRMVNIICRFAFDSDYSDFEKKHFVALCEYYEGVLPQVRKDDWGGEEYRTFVGQNYALIREAAEKEFEEYKKYISSLDLGAKDIYLVDSTTASYSAQNLIEKAAERSVCGLYYYQRKENSNYLSRTYQTEKFNVLLCFPLVEFIMSAPTPSVKSVHNGLPVYHEKNEYEEKRIAIFDEIEKGVLEFTDEMIARNLLNMEIPEPVIRTWFNGFCQNGGKEDREAFSEIRFSNDPNHADLMTLNVFSKGKEQESLRERAFRWLTLHPELYSFVRKMYYKIRHLY